MSKFTVKIGFVPVNWDDWNGWAGTPETIGWASQMRSRCLKAFAEIPGLDVVVPSEELTRDGLLSSLEDGRIIAELFRHEDVQGIMIGNMNFGMEVAVGELLSLMRRDMPILHFTTRSGPINDRGERSTDIWCGAFMTAAAIKRRGFIFEHVRTCNPEESDFARAVETFTRACCAISHFKGLHIGQLGPRPMLFESQGFNEQLMQKKFGQMVRTMDLATVFDHIDAVNPKDAQVKQIVEELSGYRIEEGTPQALINQARLEIALQNCAKELGVDCIAGVCWTKLQQHYGISACSTFARLNQKGLVTACEMDLMGAATMYAMYAASLGEAQPDFIDWTDLHPTEPNTWLAWHCGNAADSACDPACERRLSRNLRMIQWCENCHGAIETRLKTGPVTCGRLLEYDGEYTFFYGTGEIVDIPPFTRGAYGWVRVNDIGDWEDKMIECGAIHHGVLIHDSKVADALTMFCKFLGIRSVRGK